MNAAETAKLVVVNSGKWPHANETRDSQYRHMYIKCTDVWDDLCGAVVGGVYYVATDGRIGIGYDYEIVCDLDFFNQTAAIYNAVIAILEAKETIEKKER